LCEWESKNLEGQLAYLIDSKYTLKFVDGVEHPDQQQPGAPYLGDMGKSKRIGRGMVAVRSAKQRLRRKTNQEQKSVKSTIKTNGNLVHKIPVYN
jgi:hypothetical protein